MAKRKTTTPTEPVKPPAKRKHSPSPILAAVILFSRLAAAALAVGLAYVVIGPQLHACSGPAAQHCVAPYVPVLTQTLAIQAAVMVFLTAYAIPRRRTSRT